MRRQATEANPNLELIIDDEPWTVKVEPKKYERVYWSADTRSKTLTICGLNVDRTKYLCWQQYHRENKYVR
jgi:hypothetical protein